MKIVSTYCEDYDYKQRCYLNSIKIESLDKSLERNLESQGRLTKEF